MLPGFQISRIALAVALVSQAGYSAVTAVHVIDRGDVLGGDTAGQPVAYEFIKAKAYFAIDPGAAPNGIVADVELAPRNEKVQVEFSSDIYVIKPRDSAKGNGTALVEVSNRGGKALLSAFNFAKGSFDPRTP